MDAGMQFFLILAVFWIITGRLAFYLKRGLHSQVLEIRARKFGLNDKYDWRKDKHDRCLLWFGPLGLWIVRQEWLWHQRDLDESLKGGLLCFKVPEEYCAEGFRQRVW